MLIILLLCSVTWISAFACSSDNDVSEIRNELERLKEEVAELREEKRSTTETFKIQAREIQRIAQGFDNIQHAQKHIDRSQDVESRVVYFNVHISQDVFQSTGGQIYYDVIVANEGGYFNAATSTFTCPVTGLYIFMLSVRNDGDGGRCELGIDIDGSRVNVAYSVGDSGFQSTATTPAIVKCLENSEVQVRVSYGDADCSEGFVNSFTGALLYTMA